MNNDRIFYGVVAIAILCGTMLIAQCSYQQGQCQESAIKAGIKPEEISKICKL